MVHYVIKLYSLSVKHLWKNSSNFWLQKTKANNLASILLLLFIIIIINIIIKYIYTAQSRTVLQICWYGKI